MSGYRIVAVVLALAGVALAVFVEYGTPRAADVERSFGWFAFEAGPYAAAAVLALLSPYARAMCAVLLLLLGLEAYAYITVFARAGGAEAALVYLFKPLYGIGILAVGLLAAFLIARARDGRH